jgi:hypothetical protein
MTGGLTPRAKIFSYLARHDRRPAHAGMTGTLDVMFGELRDAAAAHDDD